jgi:glycosyltransferase involved in cell wall biosynthesis
MTGHVTIGIPVYRGERFVAETVDTVVAQTYRDWDVVFSVDGPDPASEAVCGRYLDDPRFRLVVQR